ncbi:hypothetical protein DFH27DRAFT_525035 [Peziza echinospora]|nr:hypothetical protein DFH27DRAFT_525035 [Peziza echinospora]
MAPPVQYHLGDPTEGGRRVQCTCNRRTLAHYVARSTYYKPQQASSAFAPSSEGGLHYEIYETPAPEEEEQEEEQEEEEKEDQQVLYGNENVEQNDWYTPEPIQQNHGWFKRGEASRYGEEFQFA